MMFIYHLKQKLQEHASIFQKSDLPTKTKEKWSKVLVCQARRVVQRQICSSGHFLGAPNSFLNWMTRAWKRRLLKLWGSARSVWSQSMCPPAPLPMDYPDERQRLKPNMMLTVITKLYYSKITLLPYYLQFNGHQKSNYFGQCPL